jgi:ElaB/YqjD/DUF883 family membrane-anchored ribosome-binding protein
MNRHNQHTHHDIGSLAEDARELMTATADVAGEKVGEARKRVAAALESAKEVAGDFRDKAVAGAKTTHKAINENPYKAVAIALGVGALVGFLIARKSGNKE